MKLKSPGKRTIRGLTVTGVVLSSLTAVALNQTQALADPGVNYVMVGSDTTQDVMNGFANAEGGNVLGSYNATNPNPNNVNFLHQVITPVKTGIPLPGNTMPTNALPAEACSFNRPNGSGEGNIALRASLTGTSSGEATSLTASTPIAGQSVTIGTTTGNLPSNLPQQNCVDIGRSSSQPGTFGNPPVSVVDPTAGHVLFLPYGVDGVTASIGSAAGTIENKAGTGTEATPATNLGALAGVGFSFAGMQAMYKDGNDAVANGVTTGSSTCYAPQGTGAPDGTNELPAGVTCSSIVPVDLYLPQSGSGTFKFWQAQVLGGNAVAGWDHQTIVSIGTSTVADYVGATVEEHDGTAVTVDPNGIAPFSIAQFISQHNGNNPRFHQAVLLPVNGMNPETAGGTLNVAQFPIQLLREIYNLVAYDRVVNTGDGNFDPNLAALFVSPSNLVSAQSLLCAQRSLISAFGFAPIPPSAPSPAGLGGEVGGHFCGQVDTTNLRAYGPTTGF